MGIGHCEFWAEIFTEFSIYLDQNYKSRKTRKKRKRKREDRNKSRWEKKNKKGRKKWKEKNMPPIVVMNLL